MGRAFADKLCLAAEVSEHVVLGYFDTLDALGHCRLDCRLNLVISGEVSRV